MLEPTSDEPPVKRARSNGKQPEVAPTRAKAASNGCDVVLPMRPAAKGLPNMIAAGTLGMHGFCVHDLRTRTYLPLEPKKKKDDDAPATSAAAAPPKRMHVVYPSVKQAMGVDWAALGTRAPPFYAALQLLCDMQTAPDAAGADLDGQLQWLGQQRLAKLQAAKRPDSWLSASFVAGVARHAEAEMAPVCAVVGGVVASEVIKIISGKGAPINNAFFFDALDSSEGHVQRLGPSFDCPWGVDEGKPVALPSPDDFQPPLKEAAPVLSAAAEAAKHDCVELD